MAFTKIAAAGIGSTGTVTLQNLVVTESIDVPFITGAASTANVRSDSLVVSGISTLSNVVVGGATTEMVIDGDLRVTGIITTGTGTITIDGTNNRIGIGTQNPETGLDLSQTTDAVALPQGTTAQRPTGNNPYMRWNTSNSALEVYNGTEWVEIITDYFPQGSVILG